MKQKKPVSFTGFISACLLLAGCSGTVPASGGQKTAVTLLTDSFCNFTALETLVESTYPDIDLQIEQQFPNSFTSEVSRRFRKNAAADLLVVNQFSEYGSAGYLTDLSGYSFCAQYEKTIMDNIQSGGRIFVLPLTGYYYGQIYNRTLFDEYGIAPLRSNADLTAAVQKLTAAGINGNYGSSFGIKKNTPTDWGVWVFGYAIPDFLSTVEGILWFDDFCNKKTGMEGVWEPVFRQISLLVDKKVLVPEAIDPQRNEQPDLKNMIEGKTALAFIPALTPDILTRQNHAAYRKGNAPAQYEYGMLPFLGDDGNPAWTMTTPRRYIGINSAVNADGNKKKKDACVRILQLISTDKGQQAVAESVSGFISYLNGCQIEGNTIPVGLEETVGAGRVYSVKLPGNAAEAIGSAFSKLVLGKLSVEECTREIDRAYLEPTPEDAYSFSVVGTLDKDAILFNADVRYRETALGNLVADSVKTLSGAQIAVVNGGGIRASLYAGDVTGADLLAACPYDNRIVVLEMDGNTLLSMLENGVSTISPRDKKYGGRFLQIAGASYVFDSGKPAGQRLMSAALSDGTPIAADQRYTVAVNDYMAGAKGYDDQGNGDGYTMLNFYSDTAPKNASLSLVAETGKTYRDAIVDYFDRHRDEIISVATEGRITDASSAEE